MPNRTKRYQESAAQIDKSRLYDPLEAIETVKKIANAKFDETVDLAVKLGVDPRHGDQMVRGVTPLPHGSGKKRRVAVFARGENAQAAEEAGADAVGAEDLVAKIQAGADKEFDVFLATPDVMGIVGRLGRVLTQRMPNPKAGTVTPDIARAVREVKTGGRVEFKVEKTGIIHMPIGKASYTVDRDPRELLRSDWRHSQGATRCCQGALPAAERDLHDHVDRDCGSIRLPPRASPISNGGLAVHQESQAPHPSKDAGPGYVREGILGWSRPSGCLADLHLRGARIAIALDEQLHLVTDPALLQVEHQIVAVGDVAAIDLQDNVAAAEAEPRAPGCCE